MAEVQDNKSVTLKQVLSSKSLKSKSTEELERILKYALASDHPENLTVNVLVAELLKRGETEDSISEKVTNKISDKSTDTAGKAKGKDLKKKVNEKLQKAFTDLMMDDSFEINKAFESLGITNNNELEMLEKSGKKPVGYVSPNGKWVKTVGGWEPVKSNNKIINSVKESGKKEIGNKEENKYV